LQPVATQLEPQHVCPIAHANVRTQALPMHCAVWQLLLAQRLALHVGYWQPLVVSQLPPVIAVQRVGSAVCTHWCPSQESFVQST
jgi:hypothetical protein